LLETLLIVPLAMSIVYYTKMLFTRMRFLEGLMPICSSCKKIQDDEGNWQQMESYIQARSPARFSHGICPHCAKKLYPEVFAREDEAVSLLADPHRGKHPKTNLFH